MKELVFKIPIAELAVIVLRIVAQRLYTDKHDVPVLIPIAADFDVDLLNAVLAEYGGRVRSTKANYDTAIGLKMWDEIEVCASDFDSIQVLNFEHWLKK